MTAPVALEEIRNLLDRLDGMPQEERKALAALLVEEATLHESSGEVLAAPPKELTERAYALRVIARLAAQ